MDNRTQPLTQIDYWCSVASVTLNCDLQLPLQVHDMEQRFPTEIQLKEHRTAAQTPKATRANIFNRILGSLASPETVKWRKPENTGTWTC